MTQNDVQIEIFKAMTPEQKLQAAFGLYDMAKELKTAWIRQLHKDWSDEQVADAVREIFTNAGT
jgi:hypothetical protein